MTRSMFDVAVLSRLALRCARCCVIRTILGNSILTQQDANKKNIDMLIQRVFVVKLHAGEYRRTEANLSREQHSLVAGLVNNRMYSFLWRHEHTVLLKVRLEQWVQFST
jgi:hypothetical protein